MLPCVGDKEKVSMFGIEALSALWCLTHQYLLTLEGALGKYSRSTSKHIFNSRPVILPTSSAKSDFSFLWKVLESTVKLPKRKATYALEISYKS